MIKGLEELNKIKDCLEIADEVDGDIIFTTGEYEEEESLNIVEKELKAFNIIKKNNMIIPIKGSDNRCWLESQMLDAKRISREEYDILKEALNNDD